MKVIVRRAVHEDALGINILFTQLGMHHYENFGFDLSAENLESTNESFMIDIMDQKDCIVIVATVNDKIIGFADLYLCNPNNDFEVAQYLYVQHCLIDSEFRHSSALLVMLREVQAISKNLCIKYIHADVFFSNTHFYENIEKMGFKKFRTRFLLEVK